MAAAAQTYTTKEHGAAATTDYRVFFFGNGQPISPFHDIPLYANADKSVLNFVLEIPKGTQEKMEISKGDTLNPIKQDVKNGKLRLVAIKYPFNYGALPQTWENPAFVHPDTKAKGDNDPVDVVDLSSRTGVRGEVRQVKVLGTYAMIDEGETDWKIVCIDVTDPLAAQLNDASDIEKVMPGKLKEVFEFLRDYKIPDGKPANVFAYDNALKDKAHAVKVIEETHAEWQTLHNAAAPASINAINTTVSSSKAFTSSADVKAKLPAGL